MTAVCQVPYLLNWVLPIPFMVIGWKLWYSISLTCQTASRAKRVSLVGPIWQGGTVTPAVLSYCPFLFESFIRECEKIGLYAAFHDISHSCSSHGLKWVHTCTISSVCYSSLIYDHLSAIADWFLTSCMLYQTDFSPSECCSRLNYDHLYAVADWILNICMM